MCTDRFFLKRVHIRIEEKENLYSQTFIVNKYKFVFSILFSLIIYILCV